ncbi:MAG: hypothetical protein M3Z04_24975, partial [Chloroflexota bacterium]|nr:hypothetical protein [Chloroflexota bacterium]
MAESTDDRQATRRSPDAASVRAAASAPALAAGDPLGTAATAHPLGATGIQLSDARLAGRGNGPVRIALALQMQQTQGNRAVQRALGRLPAVQRVVASTAAPTATPTTTPAGPAPATSAAPLT